MRPVTRTFNVKIPKGMTNGAVIRLAGQGEDGYDLHTIVPISTWEAALGGKVNYRAGKETLLL